MSLTRIAVIYGGKSTEHEVSLSSATGIIGNLSPEKYAVQHIYVDKLGTWFHQTPDQFKATCAGSTQDKGAELAVYMGRGTSSLYRIKDAVSVPLDVVFPIIHGTFGEDGCIQGLLRMAEIPFVGSDVLGSAVGMDKEVAKRLLDQAGIPNARYVTLYAGRPRPDYAAVAAKLGDILFVKPAAQGSSVGISKVKTAQQWPAALDEAFRYDEKILVEEYIKGREIEVSVLGNTDIEASVAGEIIPNAEFYSYDAKYIDADGAKLVIPAPTSPAVATAITDLALRTYRTLSCEGMTRVDFFLRNDELFVNEVNTLPGFTPISMYPKLWRESGLPITGLIDRLVQLALERFQRQTGKQRHFRT